jgi:hypothetical protein
LGSCLSAVQQNDFNKFYRAKTPRTQRKKYRPNFSELGVLCAFARDTVFPISFIPRFQTPLGSIYNGIRREHSQSKNDLSRGRWLSVKKCGFEEKTFRPESMGQCLEGHPPTPSGGIADSWGLPSNTSSV